MDAGLADLDAAIADLREIIAKGSTRLDDGTLLTTQLAQLVIERRRMAREIADERHIHVTAEGSDPRAFVQAFQREAARQGVVNAVPYIPRLRPGSSPKGGGW